MSDTQHKRAHILTSFRDEGTGESFAAGSSHLISAGAYGNYEAAGLVGSPPAAAARSGAKKPARRATTRKAGSKAAAKPSAATTAAQSAGAASAIQPDQAE